LRSLTLLTKFALVTAGLMAVLCVALGFFLNRTVRERALGSARSEGALVARVSFGRLLEAGDLRARIDPARRRAVADTAKEALSRGGVERVALWNHTGRIAYSTDQRSAGGERSRASAGLRAAFVGEVSSELLDAPSSGDRRLAIYVPLRLGKARRPAGVLELDRAYGPVASAIWRDTIGLSLFLLVSLGVLYVALWRMLSQASYRLRRQSSDSERQANHDSLTGLPNRTLFRELVKRTIAERRRAAGVAAIMVMDLDRFKEINDTLGHLNGDLLLQRVGPRLRGALRDEDTVARLGGDEYAMLLPSLPDRTAVSHAAQRVRQALREPFVAGGLSLEVEASLGIALFPDDGDGVDTLMQRADVAMYTAKEAHSGFEFYSEEQHDYSPARLALVGELRRAIDEKELTLHYQPKVDLHTGVVTGVEGLARWNHPRRGLLPPDHFIPMAEHTSLITPLTVHVLETAIVQCREWRKEGIELTVAVNLSMRNLLDLTLPAEIARLLERYSVPASSLELEITESSIMSEPRRTTAVLTKLHEMGMKLSIDDFGTGYSSLAYLKQLPVTAIKIDKSFVIDMATDPDDAMIVQSTVTLGHNLGLAVIAEGIEDRETYERLRGWGCEMGQGFHISRPVPAENLARWLKEQAVETGRASAPEPFAASGGSVVELAPRLERH